MPVALYLKDTKAFNLSFKKIISSVYSTFDVVIVRFFFQNCLHYNAERMLWVLQRVLM